MFEEGPESVNFLVCRELKGILVRYDQGPMSN